MYAARLAIHCALARPLYCRLPPIKPILNNYYRGLPTSSLAYRPVAIEIIVMNTTVPQYQAINIFQAFHNCICGVNVGWTIHT